MKRVAIALMSLVVLLPAHAQHGRFLTAEEFQRKAFPEKGAESRTLWLDRDQRSVAEAILRHPYTALRVRYWLEGDRTAWILEEIGKEQPITMGIVVDNGRIADFSVLEFRESRGGEIRYPFFTSQFLDRQLLPPVEDPKLDGAINGITGATLSVRAARKVAKLALFFHQQVMASVNDGTGDGE